jgi:hypothetical protein
MTRSAIAPALTLILSAATASAVFAQTAKPAAATPAAAPAKWVAPIKGDARIQLIRDDTKKLGTEFVTRFRIKNISSGSIALLRIDEYWYDNSNPPKIVTGDTQRHMKPIMPGEIIEMTTHTPVKPGMNRSQWSLTHANGKIDLKMVKSFNDATAATAGTKVAAQKK